MKKLLLITFLFLGFSVFSQNQKPVAVNDTLIFSWDEMNPNYGVDTVSHLLFPSTFLRNDSDPNGDALKIISAQIISNNSLSFPSFSGGSVIAYNYQIIQPFSGKDTIEYVLSDMQTPAMLDTGYVFISVKHPIHEYLNANNINARIDIHSLFSAIHKPGFEAPKGSKSYSIFASNLWFSGKNNGATYSSIRQFGSIQQEETPSTAGPISDDFGSVSPQKYQRVWKVLKDNIDFHLAHFSDPNYSLISNIKNWPAHGDTTKGEPFHLAPFVDANNDGFYNPLSGDYPHIKGDQAVFFIYNDGISNHGTTPMKTQVQGLAYAFQCPDSAIQNTIFVDYQITNYSSNTYDSTFFGLWADFDIGNAQDDYLQCDVSRGLFFGFNGDDFDEDNSGLKGYKNHPAAQGVLVLKGPLQDYDGSDNNIGVLPNQTINGSGYSDGVTDNERRGLDRFFVSNNGSFNPETDSTYYRFLSGVFSNGSPVLNINNTSQNFTFPGSSDPLYFSTGGIPYTPWDEINAGNVPSDRRGIGSSGPVTFAPGDVIELTYAFVFGRDYVNAGAQAGVDNMLKRVDSIQSYYDNGMLNPCGDPLTINETIKKDNNFKVYPNPAKNWVIIEQKNNEQLAFRLLDITGRVLKSSSMNQPSQTLNLEHLKPGTYFLEMESKNHKEVISFIKE